MDKATGPGGRSTTRRIWVAAVIAATTVVALAGCSSGGSGGSGGVGATPSATGGAPASAGPTPATTATGGSATPAAFPYQPLFPFATPADAQGWQAQSRASGVQPWHLDPGATTLAFITYLKLPTGIVVRSTTVTGTDARVSVGYRVPDLPSRVGQAAVVHLVRYGSGASAPWEVVGTDDANFSLTTPKYGSVTHSPVTVGGRITGVDESIRVRVVGLAAGSGVVGTFCCRPAGGDASTWSATVTVRGTADQVLTVVATTGGHVNPVERFTVTGFRTR